LTGPNEAGKVIMLIDPFLAPPCCQHVRRFLFADTRSARTQLRLATAPKSL
jgi:hypothetical protein